MSVQPAPLPKPSLTLKPVGQRAEHMYTVFQRTLDARVERVTGEGSVELSVQEPPKLALVG